MEKPRKMLAIEIRKTQIVMNKPVYLGLSILGISKIAMYELWYNCGKPKYEEKVKLCYMDRDFIVHVKQKIFRKTLQKLIEKKI